MGIRLQEKQQPSAVPYPATVSMTAGTPSVTSRLTYVLLGAMSTVSVSFTRRPSTPTVRAVTSADSTSTTLAITTPVTVDITQLTLNVIGGTPHTTRNNCVKILTAIPFLRHSCHIVRLQQPRRVLLGCIHFQLDLLQRPYSEELLIITRRLRLPGMSLIPQPRDPDLLLQ